MKANKLLVLALASIILAVVTIGTASATTWTYGIYNMRTTYNGGSSPSLDSNKPSGNYNVATFDTVQWANVFRNNDAHTVTATVNQFTSPTGGLYLKTMSWDVPAQSTSPAETYFVDVYNGGSSYTIHATHVYTDGTTYTSPDCDTMSFH